MSRFRSVCVGVSVLLFAAVCVAGGAATPEAAFKDFQAAMKAKDGEKAWKLLSKEAQAKVDEGVAKLKETIKKLDEATLEKVAKGLGLTVDELKMINARRLFNAGLKRIPDDKLAEISLATLEDVKVDGDKATATVKTTKKSEPARFVKEGGSWKITPPAK